MEVDLSPRTSLSSCALLDDSMEWLFNPAKAPRCALHPDSWPQHPDYKMKVCQRYVAHRCRDASRSLRCALPPT